MSHDNLDQLLMRSNPHSSDLSQDSKNAAGRLIQQSRVSKRKRTTTRAVVAGLGVAMAIPAFSFMSTAGTDPRSIPDFEIAAEFVTDTGKIVSCSIEFFNMETVDTSSGIPVYTEVDMRMVDYLQTQDWTGIGQTIYDRALQIESLNTGGSAWTQAATAIIESPVSGNGWEYGGGGQCTDADLH